MQRETLRDWAQSYYQWYRHGMLSDAFTLPRTRAWLG